MTAFSPNGLRSAALARRFANGRGMRPSPLISPPVAYRRPVAAVRRHAHARATSTLRALLPWLLVLCLAVGGGVYYKRTQVATPGDMAGTASRAVVPEDADPVARFNDTRVGQLLFMQPDGQNCRRVLFDNVSGGFRDAGAIDCRPEEAKQNKALDAGRLDAIRNSFKR